MIHSLTGGLTVCVTIPQRSGRNIVPEGVLPEWDIRWRLGMDKAHYSEKVKAAVFSFVRFFSF